MRWNAGELDPDPLNADKPDYRDPRTQKEHREFYWSIFDKDQYTCPDCGKSIDEAEVFEVHHIDGDPENGAMDNLIGLCHPCHRQRHRRYWMKQRLDEMWQEADELGDTPKRS